MAFRYQAPARRRAAVAALAGFTIIVVFGTPLAVPVTAMVALVYYAHQLAAVLVGDELVPYPSLAFVIVVNCLVVLLVQLLVLFEGAGVST